MSYLVLARKWRPQTFEEMTGQEHVVRTLSNAIKLNRVVHAYLFCGPRGVGKTTAARLLAKALNCEKGPVAQPCGACLACTEIAAGTAVDVMEIDGASNNGVENVRELRESAKYLPQRDRHKIYIIDEVHMLSGAAFNALLKTLEEPPGHVKFIFATTEAHKLPDTIVSRCQRHNFRRIPAAQIVERLKQICGAEKVRISDRSLSVIARQSDGGMRDALSLLDQILSACGSEPSDESVAEALGVIDRNLIQGFVEGLIRRDSGKLLALVEEVYNRGSDLKRLSEEIALQLRHLFVTKTTEEAPAELSDSEQQALRALSRESEAAQLARLFDAMHECLSEIARAEQPRLFLEMALLKAVQLAPVASIPELIAKLEQLGSLPTTKIRSVGAPGGRSEPTNFRA